MREMIDRSRAVVVGRQSEYTVTRHSGDGPELSRCGPKNVLVGCKVAEKRGE